MSSLVNALPTQELSATVSSVGDLTDRVRQRIRAEMTRKHLSQRDVAGLLLWTQSKVAQKLTGRTPITLDEMELLCFAVSLSPVEAVRDHGLEFCAEMAPIELRLLEQWRALAVPYRDAFLQMLALRSGHAERRSATKVKAPMSKGRAG